jgi:carbonic anhydrase
VNASQAPFAAVLGCADARVPVEFVFGQAANDLFVVRVAGAVPGAECLGSLEYAVANVETVEVVAVAGHSQCGAVTAAVDALLHPGTYLTVAQNPSLRAIVDALLAGVRIADVALRGVHGDAVVSTSNYRELLVEAAVVANTAVTASVLANALPRPVVFGIFELDRGSVGHYDGTGWNPHLKAAVTGDSGPAMN